MDRNNRTLYGEAAKCVFILLAVFIFIGAYAKALAERAKGVGNEH